METQINLGAKDMPGAFINFLKCYQSQSFSAASPGDLDANGYPITTLAADIGGSFLMPSGFAGDSVDWVVKWPSTRTLKFIVNSNVTTSSITNATVSGGSNSPMTVTSTGANGRIVFRFNNFVGTSVSFAFKSGFAHAPGSGELAILRLSDEAAYDSGSSYFTPEFVALLTDLNPATIRPMGWVQSGAANFCNQVKWDYRTTTSSISWMTRQWPPGAWGGTISGTNTYTASAATDTPGSWTDGEVFQGTISNANTSTSCTLNVGSRGAKTIWNKNASAPSVGEVASGHATFIYDALLDKVLYSGDGITWSVPIEVQVSLANTTNKHLWATIPPQADDAYVSTWAAYIRDNLASGRELCAEYSNEIWNFVFPQTHWSYQRGLALGFPSGDNRYFHGWYGLRVRQVMASITSVWGGRGGLKRVMATQAFGNASQNDTYRFMGADLDTSLGYAGYNSWVGVSYSAAPNRPIDYCDVISVAHYYQGASINDGNGYGTMPAANVTAIELAASNYDSGVPANIDAALSWLDGDIRSGTKAGSSTVQTLAQLASDIYPAWNTIAASYAGKTVEPYEGGLQIVAPTTAQCTTLGIDLGGSNDAAATALANLVTAYKNSAYGYAIVSRQFNDFLALSFSRRPSWLGLIGVSEWSLLSGDIFSTPYQTYYAFKAFSADTPPVITKSNKGRGHKVYSSGGWR